MPIVCFAAQSAVEQTYWGLVAQRVKSFWVLPEMRQFNSNLQAKVFIKINNNGEISHVQFYRRSEDPSFDQLVEKTVKSASPMPRFPVAMQQETTEVGFTFKPGMLGITKFDNNSEQTGNNDEDVKSKERAIGNEGLINQSRKQKESQTRQITEVEAKKQQEIQRNKLEEDQLKRQKEKEKKDQIFNM